MHKTYKVLKADSIGTFEAYVNDYAKEGWRIHSWQDAGDTGYCIIIVLIKEVPQE